MPGPDEIEMIAASGARIVTNFSSNMHLRSGLAPIAAAHKCGCAIAVGVDGLALDEDDDVLREMRLVQMMHGGLGFKRTWTCAEFFGLAIRNGRNATGAPGTGELVPGAPADFVTIDLDRLDRDQIMPVDPLDLLFARGNASLVRDVVVDGRTIVQRRPLHRRRSSRDREGVARDLSRQCQATRVVSACLAVAFERRCKIGSKTQLGLRATSNVSQFRIVLEFRQSGRKFRLHQHAGQGFMVTNKKPNRRYIRAGYSAMGKT